MKSELGGRCFQDSPEIKVKWLTVLQVFHKVSSGGVSSMEEKRDLS
jgi:hypothetical protein